MIYKESKENLLRQGLIKKCLLDWKSINNLIKRAYTDLKTAKRNIDDDEECTIFLLESSPSESTRLSLCHL